MVHHDILQCLVHILRVNQHILFLHVRCLEGQLLQQLLQDGMQAAGADILVLGIHVTCQLGQAVDGILGKLQLDALCAQKCLVLLQQGVLRLREDALEILLLE